MHLTVQRSKISAITGLSSYIISSHIFAIHSKYCTRGHSTKLTRATYNVKPI